MNPNETIIVIRSLVPGGVAQQDGRLIPGDRLLFVNDVNLENASLDEAVQVLKGAPKGIVQIGVAKPHPVSLSEGGTGGGPNPAAELQVWPSFITSCNNKNSNNNSWIGLLWRRLENQSLGSLLLPAGLLGYWMCGLVWPYGVIAHARRSFALFCLSSFPRHRSLPPHPPPPPICSLRIFPISLCLVSTQILLAAGS